MQIVPRTTDDLPPDFLVIAAKLGKRQFMPVADVRRMARTAWRTHCATWTLWSYEDGFLEAAFIQAFMLGWRAARKEHLAALLAWHHERAMRGNHATW